MSSGDTDLRPAPRRRLNRPLLIVGVVAALVVALIVVVVVGRGTSSDHDTASREGLVAITASDGVKLAAKVTRPTGSGKHPLVIMPSSYDANYDEYTEVGRSLTGAGFVTVSYTQRGFFTSGGQIDLAGAKTRRDVRSVIDWALRNTVADSDHIGMLGISYGAGISLLGAAADKGIRAVVALSTWTDLAATFHTNDTINVLGLRGLLDHPRTSAEVRMLNRQLQADPLGSGDEYDAFARSRSPSTYLTQLNRNKPAIMLANGWQDSLFSPAQLVPFYDKLTTPKRLQLSLGDHTGPEQQLLAGQPSPTGDAALAWLQHYLNGQANGIDTQAPVQLEDATTKTVQTYPRWPTATPRTLALAAPSPTRVAITTQATTWQAPLVVGQDSGAAIGPSQFVASARYRLPTAPVKTLAADKAFVWSSAAVAQPTRVTGSVRLSVSVAATAATATLFTYLYDTAPDGTGSLMAMTPYTATGTNNGTPVPVSFALEPIDWTLPAGHQLTVVIDTVEPWWVQAAPPGTTITVSSTATNPAQISVPVG